jgi:hypothetical protein
MSEFGPMAKTISEHASKIPFPASVGAIFDRVVSERKIDNQKYTSLSKDMRNLKSDKSHGYFISVVETAYEKLKPYVTANLRRVKRKATTPKAPQPGNVAIEKRFSLFSRLTVDNTPESSETAASNADEETEDELPEMPPVQVERSEDELEDEFHLQIHMLIREMHKILQVVLRLWADYRDGLVDVMVPSLATNIAVVLVRQAGTDFE